MKQNNEKVTSQAFFNMLSQVVLNGTNFVLIMIYTRYMSPDEYGIVSLYQAYVLFFSMICGLHSQGTISPAFAHLDKSKHDGYLSGMMLLAVITTIPFLLLVVLFQRQLEEFTLLRPLLLFLIIFHSFGNFCFNFATIKYVYMRKAQYSCLIALLVSASIIILTYCGIKLASDFIPDYLIRILSLAIPYFVCGCFILITSFAKANPFSNLLDNWKFCIPICIPLVFHGISQVILAQTDKIMLQKILQDTGIVGLYSFTVTFVHVLNSIYTALNNTWVPIYFDYLVRHDYDGLLVRAKRYNNLFTFLVAGFMMVSPEFVKLFAGSNYWSGMYLIPMVATSIYMVFLYSFAVNFEIFNKSTKLIAVGTTLAAVSNIILNYLFIPLQGMLGAAIATLISYFLLLAFHKICAGKIKIIKFPFKNSFFIKNSLIIIVLAVVFEFTIPMWLLRWLLAAAIGSLLIFQTVKNRNLF